MDLFLAGCQGAGLALAAGVFAGASGRRGAIGLLLLAAAVIGGAAVFGISLEEEDHDAYPGWALGALFAAFAFLVVRAIAEGAAARAEGAGFTGALIALGALALAALALLIPPIAIFAALALAWLWGQRRGRAQRKYEGLRSLR